MKHPLRIAVLLAASACHAPYGPGGGLVHDVYFDLQDDSFEACLELIEACEESLADLPGVVHLSAGVREPSLARPVNDTMFDVALRVVFEDLAAHDAYQIAPAHVALVERFSPNFESVRVFDSTPARTESE